MEDDVVEMEMEPEPRRESDRPLLTPALARNLFLSLAGVAVLALLVAILAIALAPRGAITILVVALVVLAIVVLAEVILLLVGRPRNV